MNHHHDSYAAFFANIISGTVAVVADNVSPQGPTVVSLIALGLAFVGTATQVGMFVLRILDRRPPKKS